MDRPHERHIARHLHEIAELRGEEPVARLLARAGLVLTPGGAERLDGAATDGADCRRYLEVVREELGETAFRFARVNFLFAGCPSVEEEAAAPVGLTRSPRPGGG